MNLRHVLGPRSLNHQNGPRVSRPTRLRPRRNAAKPSGRPRVDWTPSRQRRLLRLWLCTPSRDLNMPQICELLKEDGFEPKETNTYEQLNALLSALEDRPAVLRPNGRTGMRACMRILRSARARTMDQHATRGQGVILDNGAFPQRRRSTIPEDTILEDFNTGSVRSSYASTNTFSVPTVPHITDRSARTSYSSHHSTNRRRVWEVIRSSKTSSWLGDVASLLSGLTRNSSTSTKKSDTTTSILDSSSTIVPQPSPRSSQDSLPSYPLIFEQKPSTATQVTTFLSNKAIVTQCCGVHIARCRVTDDWSRLCVHQRLSHAIETSRGNSGQVEARFTVTRRDVNTPDALGNTLLHVAAAWGAPISVFMGILECADNVSVVNKDKETFLHILRPCPNTTSANTFTTLITYLHKRGFNFWQLDAGGRTCLNRLVIHPSFPLNALTAFVDLPRGLGKFFIEHKSFRGERLRHVICRRLNDQKYAVPQDDSIEDINLARQICARYSGSQSESGRIGPPTRAPSPQSPETDDLLHRIINDKYNVNHQASRTGRTPLMMILVRLQPGQQLQGKAQLALNRLLYLGANLDLRDQRGDTALHYAVRLALPSVVELLCAHNADVDVTNHRSQTPFHLAQLGIRDPRDLFTSPRMAARFMQCASILAEHHALQNPPSPTPGDGK